MKEYKAGKNDMYMKGSKMGGRLGDGKHASPVGSCNAFAAQKEMNRGLKYLPDGSRGYPKQAFDYKY